MTTIKMRRSGKIDGVDVIFQRTISGWVAVLGEGYAVHFLPPCEGRRKWLAKRPYSLEPIAIGNTLEDTFRIARGHYERLCMDVRSKVGVRLDAAMAEHNPTNLETTP